MSMQRQRKLHLQNAFRSVISTLTNKQNWKQRWLKLKQSFTSKGQSSQASDTSDKDSIFNAILALYAGEDLDFVIEQLDSFADRNPAEVSFYIP